MVGLGSQRIERYGRDQNLQSDRPAHKPAHSGNCKPGQQGVTNWNYLASPTGFEPVLPA